MNTEHIPVPSAHDMLSPMKPPPWLVEKCDRLTSRDSMLLRAFGVAACGRLWPSSEATRVYGLDAVRIIGTDADPFVRARQWWSSLPAHTRVGILAEAEQRCAILMADLVAMRTDLRPEGVAEETLITARQWAIRRDDMQSLLCMIRDERERADLHRQLAALDSFAQHWMRGLIKQTIEQEPIKQLEASLAACDGPHWWSIIPK